MTAFRAAEPGDQGYITTSWIAALCGPRKTWFGDDYKRTKAHVDALLDDSRTKVTVACDTTHPWQIYGWCAHSRVPGARVLQFLYVRQKQRRSGLGRQLLERCELLGKGPAVLYLFSTPDAAHIQKLGAASHISPEDFL